MRCHKLYIRIVFALSVLWESNAYSCKSPSGNNVDWFYAYKMPGLARDKGEGYGTDYIYVDVNTPEDKWTESAEGVDKSKSNIGITVSQIFAAKKNGSDFFAVYNDEDANSNKTEFGRGHMKGVLVFDDFEGFWMVHSVPRFPSTLYNVYAYPHTGKRYGQSFLCVTFPTHILNDIGTQLQFGQPVVFDKQLPDVYAKLYPNLAAALDHKMSRLPKKSKTFFSVKELSSRKNVSFTSFMKSTKFGKDLYDDLLTDHLKTALYVETWLNGGADLPSVCDRDFQVYNLRSVSPYKAHFNSSKDHSKWAVSKDGEKWICVGDINRQPSQFRRGGGTLCQRNDKVSALFRQSIGDVECCNTDVKSTETIAENFEICANSTVYYSKYSYTLIR